MRNSLLLALFLAVNLSFSSEKLIHDVSTLSFRGVYVLSNVAETNRGFCVVSEVGKSFTKRDLVLEVFDTELKSITTVTHELSASDQFNAIAFDGTHLFLNVIETSFKPKAHYFSFDAQGKLVAQKSEKITMTVSGNPDYYPRWIVAENGNTYLLTHLKEKKVGYQIAKISPDLEAIWSHKVIPKKGESVATNLIADETQVYVVQSQYSWGNNVNNRIVALSDETGELLFESDLLDDSYSFYPGVVKCFDGEVIVAGMYYKGQKIGWKEPEGMFVQKLLKDGGLGPTMLASFRDLKDELKTKSPGYWFRINPDIAFFDILKKGDHYVLVGELYKALEESLESDPNAASSSEIDKMMSIRLMDFMAFEFSSDLHVVRLDRIERPHMIVSIQPGGAVSDSILESGSYLNFVERAKSNAVFSYQFASFTDDQLLSVGFINYEDYRNWAYQADIHQQFLISTQLSEWKPEIVSKLEKVVDFFDEDVPLFEGIEHTGMIEYDSGYIRSRGMIKSMDGTILLFQFSPLEGELVVDRYR